MIHTCKTGLAIATLCGFVWLQGCAYVPSSFNLKIPQSTSGKPQALIADLRAPDQKIYRTPEMLGKFAYYFGDQNFVPDRMDLLRHRFNEKLGARLNGRKIAVTVFEVSLTYPSSEEQQYNPELRAQNASDRRPVIATIGDPLLEYTVPRTLKCEIAGTIDDRSFEGTYIGMYGVSDVKSGIQETIEQAIDIAIRDIFRKSLVD